MKWFLTSIKSKRNWRKTVYFLMMEKLSRMSNWNLFFVISRCSSSCVKCFQQSSSFSLSSIFCDIACYHNERFQVSYRYSSSRSKMFFKIGVLKNFENFTGKHLCCSLFLIVYRGWMEMNLARGRRKWWNGYSKLSGKIAIELCQMFIIHCPNIRSLTTINCR